MNPLAEGSAIARPAGSVLGVDPEGQPVSYAIAAGNDAGLFSIDAAGAVRADGVFDFEAVSSYLLEVTVSDGVNIVSRSLTVQIADVDEAPLAIGPVAATVAELGVVTIDIASLHRDPEGQSVVVQSPVPMGANSASVTTDGTSITYSHDGSETVSDTITYAISDPAGNTTAGQLEVTVTPVNDRPSIDSVGIQSVEENQPSATFVVDLVATDTDGPNALQFSIVSGDGFGAFDITSAGRIRTTIPLDRETRASYALEVSVNDGLETELVTVRIDIADIDEAPLAAVVPNLTVGEGGAATTVDIAALHLDPESQTLTIASSSLSATNSASLMTDGSAITYQHDGSETVGDQVFYVIEDPAGNQVAGSFVVVVVPRNNPPIVTPPLDDATIDEGLPAGRTAFTITAVDSDGPNPLSHTIVGGDPSGQFEITGSQIRTTEPLDHESTGTFALQVETFDGSSDFRWVEGRE